MTTEESALCYICYEEENATTNPFVLEADNVCDCRGTMKVHQMCYEMARGLGDKCKTCRTKMRRPTATDDRWDTIINVGKGEKTFIMKKACGSDVRHGPSVEMAAATGGTGMFYIKKKFNFLDGELSGPYTLHDETGEITGEGAYLRGQKHGLCTEKALIGLHQSFTVMSAAKAAYIINLKLGGEFISGRKNGVHLSLSSSPPPLHKNPFSVDCVIVETNYKDDLKDNVERHYIAHQYDEQMTIVDPTDTYKPKKLTCRELEWRGGQQHGWERVYTTDGGVHNLVLEAHHRDGQLDGPVHRYEYVNGKQFLMASENYFMDKKEGAHQKYKMIYVNGEVTTYLSESYTYREGVREGPCYFGWQYEDGHIVGATGVMHDNQEYSGLFVSPLQNYTMANMFEIRQKKKGKLNGELAHIRRGIASDRDDLTYKSVHYKDGLKHGAYDQWITGGLQTVALNYHEGKLHGECGLYYEATRWDGKSRDPEKRRRGICEGKFRHGVPVGVHKLEQHPRGFWMEEICYDSEGQLHGICTYRRQGEFTLECRLSYKHGQLAGRQVIYDEDGREMFAWTVDSGAGADGRRLKGLVEWFGEGGYGVETRWISREEDLTLEDIIDEPVCLREPAKVEIRLCPATYKVERTISIARSWIIGGRGVAGEDEERDWNWRTRTRVKACPTEDGWMEMRKVEEERYSYPKRRAENKVWCSMCCVYHARDNEADQWDDSNYDSDRDSYYDSDDSDY